MDEFETWWKAYPRKEHRIAALRAWKKLSPSPLTIAKMMADLPRWQAKDPQYVPHGASYINGRRWEDERVGVSRIAYEKGVSTGALASLRSAAAEAAAMTPEQRKANQEKLSRIIASVGK